MREELDSVRRRVLANPLYQNRLIDEGGQITTVLIETDAYSSLGVTTDELAGFDDLRSPAPESAPRRFITGEENSAIVLAIRGVVERYDAPDFRVHVAGSPVMMHHLQATMRHDMGLFSALALLIIALSLALLFRRVAGVVLPILVSLLALIATFGLLSWIGVPLTIPSQILPSFLLAVGVRMPHPSE